MPTSEERVLENALVTAVGSLAYIAANSIPVRNWDDQATARDFPCVSVMVQTRERIAPNADFYRFPVEVRVWRHRGDDPNQAVSDLIFNEVSDWANSINAVADFSCDGITYNAGIEEADDKLHNRGVSFDLYDTITPA